MVSRSSSLGSGLGEDEEGVGRKGSVDRLSCSDDPEEAGQDSDDADDDMVLLEDDQVADFASSMLAAISCWHSRARALLSLGDATVRPTAASSSCLPPPACLLLTRLTSSLQPSPCLPTQQLHNILKTW